MEHNGTPANRKEIRRGAGWKPKESRLSEPSERPVGRPPCPEATQIMKVPKRVSGNVGQLHVLPDFWPNDFKPFLKSELEHSFPSPLPDGQFNTHRLEPDRKSVV